MGSYKIIPNVGKLLMKSIETSSKGRKSYPEFFERNQHGNRLKNKVSG